MARVIATMTVSLDGFVADTWGSAGRLYTDLDALQDTPYMNSALDETGAVLMGRRTFQMAEDQDSSADSTELRVPIFVVTHTPPPIVPGRDGHLTFTFVTDGIHSAVARAQAAAGDKAVTVVGGPIVIDQLIHCGLVDELRVDVMPVLLGTGLRLFADGLPALDLETLDVQRVGERTSMRFQVRTA